MNAAIKAEAQQRGITRLCHFTPSRNLIHIASGVTGILATKKLEEEERKLYTPTDLLRLDGHPGYISCSVEFPNAWYFDKARGKDILFKDWVVLLMNAKHLWAVGTRFCARNAAGASGAEIAEGEAAFRGMFADSVRGAYGNTYTRSSSHLPCCPTDEQAEVLIPDQVPLDDVLAVVVSSESQAKSELARFRAVGVPADRFRLVVAPTLFDKRALSTCIRSGKRPTESVWSPGGGR